MGFLRRIPLKLFWAVVVLSIATGEWYPLSSFPMYSSFEPYAYYIYVADGEGRIVNLMTAFGVSPGEFRKTYAHFHREERLNELMARGSFERAEATAGRRALHYLAERSRSVEVAYPLRLHQVDIEVRKTGLAQEDRVIGEMDAP